MAGPAESGICWQALQSQGVGGWPCSAESGIGGWPCRVRDILAGPAESGVVASRSTIFRLGPHHFRFRHTTPSCILFPFSSTNAKNLKNMVKFWFPKIKDSIFYAFLLKMEDTPMFYRCSIVNYRTWKRKKVQWTIYVGMHEKRWRPTGVFLVTWPPRGVYLSSAAEGGGRKVNNEHKL